MKNLKLKKLLFLISLVAISSCSGTKKKYLIRKVNFIQTEYSEIMGWSYDNHLVSLNAFANSCNVIMKRKGHKQISNLTYLGGKSQNWQRICIDLQKRKFKSNRDARRFFEKWFTPYKVLDSKNNQNGKFTGYYEIELNGSVKKNKKSTYPVYMPPKNLSIHKNKNYLSHSSINRGSLKGKNLELLWVDNPGRLYFMHIQGSGRVKLSNGKLIRLGYAGENGFGYKSIGPYFKDFTTKKIDSALDMMNWLHKNPKDGKKIMEKNQSYVFFRKIEGDGPIGAQGIPLTIERSIALDSGIYPYGTPVWIETNLPNTQNYLERKYKRLFITQDTGGAIKGAVRGDIFFGHSKRAEELACYMNNRGKMYALFPKSVKIPKTYSTS